MDLRIGLESEAASLAAQRHAPADLRRIGAALATLEAGIRAAQPAVSADIAFHLAIIRATGNAYFIDLFAQLGPLMIPRARVDLFKNDRQARVRYLALIQQEHAQIYQAIARRDAEAARAAVRLHLTNSRERLRTALEQGPGGTLQARSGARRAWCPPRLDRRMQFAGGRPTAAPIAVRKGPLSRVCRGGSNVRAILTC